MALEQRYRWCGDLHDDLGARPGRGLDARALHAGLGTALLPARGRIRRALPDYRRRAARGSWAHVAHRPLPSVHRHLPANCPGRHSMVAGGMAGCPAAVAGARHAGSGAVVVPLGADAGALRTASGGYPNRGADEAGLTPAALWRLLAGGSLLRPGRSRSSPALPAPGRHRRRLRAGLLLTLLAQAALFAALVVAGPIVGRVPDDLLPAVRFIAPMQLTLAVAAGAAASAWTLTLRQFLPRGRVWAAGAMVPAIALWVLLGVTTARHVGTRFSLFFDRASVGDEVREMASMVSTLPEGRLVAAERWGISHHDHWWYYLPAVDGGKPVLRGYGGAALQWSASYRYLYRHADFDPRRHARLYNVRWLLARKGYLPQELAAPVRAETATHVLLELDGGGWIDPIQLVAWAPTSKVQREARIRRWLNGPAPPAPALACLWQRGGPSAGGPRGRCAACTVSLRRHRRGRGRTVGTFLLKVTYHPGWRVRIDGQPAELLRVSPDMMAVQVGSGRHRLAFAFRRPWWSFALLAGSLLSLWLLVQHERCRAVIAGGGVRL